MADRKDKAPNEPEDMPMATTDEVAAVVQNVQRKARERIRWSLGKHTAELALRALDQPRRTKGPPSSKSRRRKRHKRLL